MKSHEPKHYRYPYLDLARVFAACSVYGFHAGLTGFDWGYIGVDFFMVLSGFVVTVSVLQRNQTSVASFLKARQIRLIPGLLVFIAVATACLLWLADAGERLSTLGYVLPSGLYYSNWYSIFEADQYFNQTNINVFIHVWSLSVEEQFYLIFSLLLLIPFRRRAYIKIAALISITAWLIYSTHNSWSHDRFYFGTDSRATQFLVGSLLANYRFQIFDFLKRIPNWILIAASALVATYSMWLASANQKYFFNGFLIATLAAASYILISIKNSEHAQPSASVIARLGHSSYLQYLLHMPLLFVLSKNTSYSTGWKLIGLGLLIGISYLITSKFEIPVQAKLKLIPKHIAVITLPIALVVTTLMSYQLISRSIPEPLRNTQLSSGFYFCKDATVSCHRAGNKTGKTVLLLADSVGSSLLDKPLMDFVQGHPGTQFVSLALPVCAIRNRLTTGGQATEQPRYQDCQTNLPRMIKQALRQYDVQGVVVSSASDQRDLFAKSGKALHNNDSAWLSEATTGARELLKPIAKAGIPIVFAVPGQKVQKIDCIDSSSSCASPRKATVLQRLYQNLAQNTPHSRYVDINNILCETTTCPLIIDGFITRNDGTHFTRVAAGHLGPKIMEAINVEILLGLS